MMKAGKINPDYVPLRLRPTTLAAANAYVATVHRHHGPVRGCRFCLSVIDDTGTVRGVVIAGRPVSRMYNASEVLEVTRLATDGVPNACSMLYAAVRKTAKAMGYKRVITYVLESEDGTSLRAAGWILSAVQTGGGSWSSVKRPRIDKHPTTQKARWEVEFEGAS